MNKDSLVSGAILGVVFGIPVGVTTGIAGSVLGEALWIVILSGIVTIVLVFLFGFLGAELAADYIVYKITMRTIVSLGRLGFIDRTIFFILLVIGEVASVSIPLLVLAFVL